MENETKKEICLEGLDKVSGGGPGVPTQYKCPDCGCNMEWVPSLHEIMCPICGLFLE